MSKTSIYLSLAIVALVLSSCKDVLNDFQSKPNALGKMNEIVAVCDSKLWETGAGDSTIYYFESPYPIMPAPEPLFDVRHFSTEDLNNDKLRKELRTYVILADLSDSESRTTAMVKNDLGETMINRFYAEPDFFTTAGLDKWARGQLVVYIVGTDSTALKENIVRAFPRIAERIRQHDKRQLSAQTYVNGNARALSNLVETAFGFSIDLPGDFQMAINEDNFMWLRKDNRDVTSNIAIKSFPYSDEGQLELEGLIDMRDRLGVLIQSSSVGSFMRTNAEDLPVYTYKKELDGRYTVESRGIWEMTEDFLGGPFINYAIVNGNQIILIDAFVYAPGKSKRDYVQQLELVVSSIKFNG